MMVIFGGRSSDQAAYHMGVDYYSNKVSYYNTLTSTWYTPDIRPPVPSGRRSHSALALENGKMLIFGGEEFFPQYYRENFILKNMEFCNIGLR